MDEKELNYLSVLSRLSLTDQEKIEMQQHFDTLLKHITIIAKAPSPQDIHHTSQAILNQETMRHDKAAPSAPYQYLGSFHDLAVPRVIEE